MTRRQATTLVVALVTVLVLAACSGTATPGDTLTSGPGPGARTVDGGPRQPERGGPRRDDEPATARLTLAFGGDVHFEGGLRGVPRQPGSTLGPMSRYLRDADLAMVNLESAITRRGRPAAKELEDPAARYWFRTPPSALGVLARSGVDVTTVANNHGVDYGRLGLRDTLRAARRGPLPVIGVGRDARRAFAPYRTTIRGTDVAVLAADASPIESADPVWTAVPGSGPGVASARTPRARQLVTATRAADRTSDLVVVYLHWGAENTSCPTGEQEQLAARLSEAGADIVVGAHAHVPQGAGSLGGTYVSYGLGNFFWYHGRVPVSGVLQLTVRGDEVVRDAWVPGRLPPDGGGAVATTGAERAAGIAEWQGLRACTDLAPGPGAKPGPAPEPAPLPAFSAEVRRIGPALARRMRSSYDPAVCPVALSDLRYVTPRYVGFFGQAHRGEIVVHRDVVPDTIALFRAMYEARFPIWRMRLVDRYGGDDDRSMAANNTSAYNCRRVAGSTSWSDHAYGRAIDINPVQNPYVVGEQVLPASGRRFVDVDRSPGARAARGVIREGDVVSRTLGAAGWSWGGGYSEPDYQHFSAP